VLDQLKAEVERLKKPVSDTTIEVPDVISTPEDVQAVLRAERQKEQRERNARQEAIRAYESSYTRQLNALGEANEDLHDEIMELIMTNAKANSTKFNEKFSDNPSADARINYTEAKAFILAKKLSEGVGKQKLPVRETAQNVPAQPAVSSTKMVAKAVTMPKLDADAAAYVAYLRRQGTPEDEIASYLKD